MRAAFKADFWKLHRVIEQDLKKGVYRLEVKGSGFRVQGSGFRVQGSGSRVQGSEFRAQGRGFRFQV